jgi:hypothetical protein
MPMFGIRPSMLVIVAFRRGVMTPALPGTMSAFGATTRTTGRESRLDTGCGASTITDASS